MKFEIQRFADTVTSSSVGNLNLKFYDGDTRTLPIDDPRADLTATEINTFVNVLKTTQPLIGDKAGASITGADKFTIVDKTTVKFDLAE